MGQYVEPERWNEKSKEAAERANKLRDEIKQGTDAQRYNYVFGTHSKKGRAEYDAINHLLNVKESEKEDLEQRALDQYPKGTKMGGRTSRNRAEYGNPVDLPDAETGKKKGGMIRSSASRRADGMASKGKTRGKFL